MWDTAGQEKFRAITKNYYKGSDAIILMYDINNLNSFKSIKGWITQIKQYVEDSLIILIGNKNDLNNQLKVKTEVAKKYADDNGIHFMESSAKLNINVNETFMFLTNKLISMKEPKRESKSIHIKRNSEKTTNETNKKSCNC